MRRDRRTVLAAMAAGTGGLTGGCLERIGELTGSAPDRQVSLRLKAPPSDDDPFADGIARTVASWLRAAGIRAEVVSLAPSELRTQVLVNEEFDLFVARVPGRYRHPDALYSLLHSRYAVASGWNNPFGVTDTELDERLDAQRRRSGRSRTDAIAELATHVAETQPFSVVCFPEGIRAARRDRFAGFSRASLEDPIGFLALDRTEDADADGGGPRGDELHLATTDELVTQTLNPLSTVGVGPAAITGLLYDPLGRHVEDGIVPWLAEDWTITDGTTPSATVRLRRDQTWHDDRDVTAADVAFTYAFLADTRLADSEDSIPVPRFLDRTNLVEDVRAVDDLTARIRFVECDPAVAARALTVPVLPEHVWRERANPGDDVENGDGTGVFGTNNLPPVGSGPLSFGGNVPGERLSLERNESHFLVGDDHDPILDHGPTFDRLVFEVTGASTAAVERVVSGQVDATLTPLPPRTVPRIAAAESVRLYTDSADAFYVVGYNARRPHLSNARFRTVLGGLLDQGAIVRSVFEGYATPAVSPLAGTSWLPSELRWDGTDPATPFLGTDGNLDVDRARDAFRDIGYRYDGDVLRTR